MHFKSLSLDKNAKRVRDIFHKKQFLFMSSYRFFVDLVSIFSIIALAISNSQEELKNRSFFHECFRWYLVDAKNDTSVKQLIDDDAKTNRDLRKLNKKTSIHEFKTYRNTRDFLFKTSVADNIRDTTTINWYTTASNTIRTIIVIHVRFFIIIVVHHVAFVAQEFISFRNDQNLNASFCRSA